MLHIPPTNLLLLAAKQEPYKKAHILTIWEKFRRKDQQAEKDRRVTGLHRRTREEIAKWNLMTALRFQGGGGGRHALEESAKKNEEKKKKECSCC